MKVTLVSLCSSGADCTSLSEPWFLVFTMTPRKHCAPVWLYTRFSQKDGSHFPWHLTGTQTFRPFCPLPPLFQTPDWSRLLLAVSQKHEEAAWPQLLIFSLLQDAWRDVEADSWIDWPLLSVETLITTELECPPTSFNFSLSVLTLVCLSPLRLRLSPFPMISFT